jgi:hypothetical protein
MKCEERFYDYIDYVQGKLPLDITVEIDKHILSCNKCKEEIENIKSFSLILDNFRVEEPDEIYFANLVPVINERIENKKRTSIAITTHDMIFSVLSVIIFAVVLVFTYNVSNTQISTGTFANDEVNLNVDNYALFGYETYEDIDGNTEKIVADAIAGLLFHDEDDWFSSQENVKSYLASFSDDEMNNIIDELNNTSIINEGENIYEI